MANGNGDNGGNGTDLAQVPAQEQVRSLTLFGTSDPAAVIVGATRMAKALAPVIEDQKLYKQIGNKKHLFIEAWTLCGSMLGVFPVCTWTRRIEGGWEARCEARLRDGSVIGAAEAICKDNEANWQKRDDYAIKSMAQTRAASKALRMPLGFIVVLGGFDATPAEEMVHEAAEARAASAPPAVASPAPAGANRQPQVVGKAPGKPAVKPTGPVISEAQAKRFYAICRSAGKESGRITSYLVGKFGISDDRQIPKAHYEEACKWAADQGTNEEPPDEPSLDELNDRLEREAIENEGR